MEPSHPQAPPDQPHGVIGMIGTCGPQSPFPSLTRLGGQNPTASSPLPNFSMAITPMRSAYRVHEGAEPEFTNLAFTKFNKEEEGPFCETLDYIFLSDSWSHQGEGTGTDRGVLALLRSADERLWTLA